MNYKPQTFISLIKLLLNYVVMWHLI